MLSSVFAVAQIKKGATLLGGNISGSTQTTKVNGTEDQKRTIVSVSPSFGKAIRDNLVLGGDLNVSFSEQQSISSPGNDIKENGYGMGVLLRKYAPIGKDGFYIFLQGRFGVGYNSSKYESSTPSKDHTKKYGIDIVAYPGVAYAVNKRLHLEAGFNGLAGLNFYTEKRTVSGSTSYTTKTTGGGLFTNLNNFASSLSIGFRLLLNKS